MTTEYILRVVKAANGWVVSNFDYRDPGSLSKSTMVVMDNADLAGTIAAMLVAGRLDGEKEREIKVRSGYATVMDEFEDEVVIRKYP